MPGLPELLVVLVIILVVLGPKRLPSLGRQLGGGLREFKDGLTHRSRDADDEAVDASPAPPTPELTRAQQQPSDEPAARSGG